jgi:DNA-damage-inducible protein J
MCYNVATKSTGEMNMAANAVVRARIDEHVKQEASAVLSDMGLTISDAFRMLLTRVAAEKQLPFELRVPNAVTRTAMAESQDIIASRRTRFKDQNELIDVLEKESGK